MPVLTAIVLASWAWGEPIHGVWLIVTLAVDCSASYITTAEPSQAGESKGGES